MRIIKLKRKYAETYKKRKCKKKFRNEVIVTSMIKMKRKRE